MQLVLISNGLIKNNQFKAEKMNPVDRMILISKYKELKDDNPQADDHLNSIITEIEQDIKNDKISTFLPSSILRRNPPNCS